MLGKLFSFFTIFEIMIVKTEKINPIKIVRILIHSLCNIGPYTMYYEKFA